MRLVKLTTLYPGYWRGFYAARPGLAQKPYAEQKAALDHDGFGWGDFWSRALNKRGWQATDLSCLVGPLDAALAREKGLAQASGLELAAAQVRELAPDILWIDDYNAFAPAWITQLRQSCPSIRKVLGWCGAPYPDATAFSAYDLVLSCVPELVADFKAQGLRAAHLNHAFEPDLLQRLAPLPSRDLGFSFVGQVKRGDRYHEGREKLLLQLVEKTPLTLFMPAQPQGPAERLKHWARRAFWMAKRLGLSVPAKVAAWRQAPVWQLNPRLEARRQGEAYGLEMARVMARSKVTLNKHIDLSANSASNMRLFEATGMGACLLTDAKANLGSLFEAGKEVVAYESPEDCAEKAAWLLAHDAERAAIATAGQARTLKDHSFDARALELEAMIKAIL